MDYSNLDNEIYRNVPLYKIEDNGNGLPFFIRKYSTMPGTDPKFHRHEYMQINYVCKGKGKHRINNSEFILVKGDIFVIPPYVPHCILPIEGNEMEVYEFEFVPGFINQSFETGENTASFLDFAYIEPFLVCENKVRPRLNLTGTIQSEIEEIIKEASLEYEAKKPGYTLLIKSLLLKLLVLVGREFTVQLESSESFSIFQRHREAILDALKYIKNHSNEDLNADDIALKCILSPSYFRYLFKNITSKTFTEYLNDTRIEKALEMLKTTDKRVLDISLETGFNNVSHFNKVFKSKTGLSPVEFRKTTQK
jgi:AraC-type DNA-binding domain-containing proteins